MCKHNPGYPVTELGMGDVAKRDVANSTEDTVS